MDQSCGTKYDWFCWQVWSLHTIRKCHFRHFKKPRWKGRGGRWLKLKCSWNVVFSLKVFGFCKELSSQYKDIYIILLVERIDDMKLSYKLFDNKFQASPESVFELPRVKKLLTQIMHKWWVLFYQGKKLKNFQRGKDSIKNNVVLYVSSITLCLEEWFGELTGDGGNVEIDTRVVDEDKILHNICTVLDIRNWVLPDEIPVNSDNVPVFLRAQLESVEILFSRLEEVFLKINSNISLNIMREEYISIITYSVNHLNPLVSDPR